MKDSVFIAIGIVCASISACAILGTGAKKEEFGNVDLAIQLCQVKWMTTDGTNASKLIKVKTASPEFLIDLSLVCVCVCGELTDDQNSNIIRECLPTAIFVQDLILHRGECYTVPIFNC